MSLVTFQWGQSDHYSACKVNGVEVYVIDKPVPNNVDLTLDFPNCVVVMLSPIEVAGDATIRASHLLMLSSFKVGGESSIEGRVTNLSANRPIAYQVSTHLKRGCENRDDQSFYKGLVCAWAATQPPGVKTFPSDQVLSFFGAFQ